MTAPETTTPTTDNAVGVVGGQVDSEVRRGLLALDLWLRHRPTRP